MRIRRIVHPPPRRSPLCSFRITFATRPLILDIMLLTVIHVDIYLVRHSIFAVEGIPQTNCLILGTLPFLNLTLHLIVFIDSTGLQI